MIKLKDIIKEISQEEWERWYTSNAYKKLQIDWLQRHGAILDNKGRVEAYHGTTPNRSKSIKQTGFHSGSYFSLKKDYSRRWGVVVLKVYLPLDAIDFVGGDIVSIRPINWQEVI